MVPKTSHWYRFLLSYLSIYQLFGINARVFSSCCTSARHAERLHWRHNGHDSVSNHQPCDCLLICLFRRDQRWYQSSASLAFVWGIHRRPVNSPHKWPVTRKMFPFDDVITWDLIVWWTASFWLQWTMAEGTVHGGSIHDLVTSWIELYIIMTLRHMCLDRVLMGPLWCYTHSAQTVATYDSRTSARQHLYPAIKSNSKSNFGTTSS